MSDIPEGIRKLADATALMICTSAESMTEVIARALMAADEAATKRERERAAKCVKDCASALDFPSVYMGGPSRDAIRKAAVLAEAILKGEA